MRDGNGERHRPACFCQSCFSRFARSGRCGSSAARLARAHCRRMYSARSGSPCSSSQSAKTRRGATSCGSQRMVLRNDSSSVFSMRDPFKPPDSQAPSVYRRCARAQTNRCGRKWSICHRMLSAKPDRSDQFPQPTPPWSRVRSFSSFRIDHHPMTHDAGKRTDRVSEEGTMRREHWSVLTFVWLGILSTSPAAQAGPRDNLPSFVPPPSLVPPPPHVPPPPCPAVGQPFTLPPGTAIIVPPPGEPPAASAPAAPPPAQSWRSGCPDCERPNPGSWRDGKWYPGQRICVGVTRLYYNHFEPKCGTDGCLMPLGCSNLHLEYFFIFGSCRQFHGTGTAAPPSFIHPNAKP